MGIQLEYAYAAGLFDGEGCLAAYMKMNRHANWELNLMVQVAMVEKAGPELLQELFGGNLAKRKMKNPKHRDYWFWGIYNRTSITEFLNAVAPYMRVKNEQVELFYELMETYSDDKQAVVEKSVWNKRLKIVKKIKEAKAKKAA